ncbi:MAG: FAD-dependent oxidoreductase [Gemmatimonadaceae bacterium]|nr:FAD-dependent oxidoreductase [Gemmatimonadaceae bacterium]
MSSAPDLPALPTHLDERIVRQNARGIRPDGRYVLYWTRTASRATENPALDVALTIGNALGRPVLVYHALSERYPYASDRHHWFILEAMRDLAADYEARGIRYVAHVERPGHRGPWLQSLANDAALVVTEHLPVPPLREWTAALAQRTSVAVWSVDTACIVPMPLVPKAFDRAFAFKDATARLRRARLGHHWVDVAPMVPTADLALPFAPVDVRGVDLATLIATCDIDHAVGPVSDTRGGRVAGTARWRAFVDGGGLARYADRRNDAARADGVSRMSPYLHHGMVSPFALAREASERPGAGPAKWLEELLVWRELAYAFCHHTRDLHSLQAIPAWARDTLAAHANDWRERLPWETLARGRTGDALWDAAQQSLLRHGELHNNVRMTWGKAMIRWSADADDTLARLIDLNHRYALDGRDPASYGGLLWCLGQFDRPFAPEAPVIGTVRPRDTREHGARLDLGRYANHVSRPTQPTVGRVAVIGAGLAGLAAARTLHDHGAEVTVFEKSRGLGGRAATRREGVWSFDHGAQYATFRDPRLTAWVTSWVDAGLLSPWQGRIAVRDAAGWRATSDGVTRWVATPGMSALGRHLGAGLAVRLGTAVARADRSSTGWTLFDAEGSALGAFDRLLVTAPAPQAAALLRGGAPALAAQCAEVRFHPCRAVMCVLERAARVSWDAAFVNDDPHLAWVARNATKPGRDAADETWVLHAPRAYSLETLEADSDEAIAPMLRAFRTLLGDDAPAVAYSLGHRWRYAIPDPVLPTDAVWDTAAQAGVAGDWCGGPRVEGALLSGMALAGRVLGAAHTH